MNLKIVAIAPECELLLMYPSNFCEFIGSNRIHFLLTARFCVITDSHFEHFNFNICPVSRLVSGVCIAIPIAIMQQNLFIVIYEITQMSVVIYG